VYARLGQLYLRQNSKLDSEQEKKEKEDSDIKSFLEA